MLNEILAIPFFWDEKMEKSSRLSAIIRFFSSYNRKDDERIEWQLIEQTVRICVQLLASSNNLHVAESQRLETEQASRV